MSRAPWDSPAVAVSGPPSNLGVLRVADIWLSCNSLGASGCVLAWWMVNAPYAASAFQNRQLMEFIFISGVWPRARRSRLALPVSLGDFEALVGLLSCTPLELVREEGFFRKHGKEAWSLVACFALNCLAGAVGPLRAMGWSKAERRLVESVRKSVDRLAEHHLAAGIEPSLVEKDLQGKRVNYAGEEVGTCHQLTLQQLLPALPPPEHGGSIDLCRFISQSSVEFLMNPMKNVVEDVGQTLPKLEGKIHVHEGEMEGIADELVRRGVCRWTPLREVLEFRGQKVLNGLFGVEKPGTLPGQQPTLRLIMNLVPSNSIIKEFTGVVKTLPQITSWLNIVVDEGHEVRVWQSDMSNAFYLFAVPDCWGPLLSFNVRRKGSMLGYKNDDCFVLSCRVLPMGWSNSVSLMQEASDNILKMGGLDPRSQILRGVPLPIWVPGIVQQATKEGRTFWHVYLDNFAAGEIAEIGQSFAAGDRLHQLAETAWAEAHVISSAKKRKRAETEAQELGAHINGLERTIGGSPERLLKLVQATLFLLSRPHLSKRLLQVVAGRWVHVFQFRRPAMACLDDTWKFINAKGIHLELVRNVKRELFMCMALVPLLHTFLGAPIGQDITASDASNTGGAVGISAELSPEGQDFTAAMFSDLAPRRVPILVVSLFNGIGGALRCYDVLGLVPAGAICFDIHSPSQRVTGKRWPHAELLGDVREITAEMVQSWFRKYVPLTQVHLWAGFPCTDLSSVKSFRQGLEGPASSLFWEVIRVKKLLETESPHHVEIKYTAENVASMDRADCEKITNTLDVRPYHLNCSDAVPMQRPRLCWTSETLEDTLGGLVFAEENHWTKITAEAVYPSDSQWISDGSAWPGRSNGHILPTAMKSIKRKRPPPNPAGLNRCDKDTIDRWTADCFRFPPYHYQDRFIFWTGDRWRLCNPDEKEILLGYRAGHTTLCMSASNIKKDTEKFIDERLSLLGDSFSIFSFIIPAYCMAKDFLPQLQYCHLANRMGLAPGFCAPIAFTAPLNKFLQYGLRDIGVPYSVQHLNQFLMTRVNHTGSDIRITTGQVLNPRGIPRQSIQAGWWKWSPVFRTRWKQSEHINSLELRAIFLALKYQILHNHCCQVRLFHVTDSFVAMSIIAKGRTASKWLGKLVKEMNAWLLGFGIAMVIGHVESSENPTDEASRQMDILCPSHPS